MAERRKQIAESPNGAFLLEPYQLVSQNKLEPLLKEVAEATPNVTVRYGIGLEEFSQDDDGVTVKARTVDGKAEKMQGTYLVGCDGGTSTVRKQAAPIFKRIVTGRVRDFVDERLRKKTVLRMVDGAPGTQAHGVGRFVTSQADVGHVVKYLGRVLVRAADKVGAPRAQCPA